MENQGGKEKKNGEDLRWAVHLHRRTRDRKKVQDSCSVILHRGLRARVSDFHLLAFMHRVITGADMRYTAIHKCPYLSLAIQNSRSKQQCCCPTEPYVLQSQYIALQNYLYAIAVQSQRQPCIFPHTRPCYQIFVDEVVYILSFQYTILRKEHMTLDPN